MPLWCQNVDFVGGRYTAGRASQSPAGAIGITLRVKVQ
jgi:hypothetical protein